MNITRYLIVLLLLAPHFSMAVPQELVRIKVIVHRSNPVTELTREEVSQFFLKKNKVWKTRLSVTPVDLKSDSPIRYTFSLAIHRKVPLIIKTYWQQQIFSGNEIPPAEKETEKEIQEIVGSDPGAIAYVSSDTRLTSQIKVITVTYLERRK
jgi:ABC-type phosphate transport system substrate-binding protein